MHRERLSHGRLACASVWRRLLAWRSASACVPCRARLRRWQPPGRPTRSTTPRNRSCPSSRATEADRDRVEALSLFAAGRTHEQREEYRRGPAMLPAGACGCDPQSPTLARAVIPVAIRLQRYDEAARYALKAAELKTPIRCCCASWASILADEGDWRRAAALYEKALAAARQGQANSRRHPAADGNRPALPSGGKIEASGRVLRPSAPRPRPSQRVRPRRAITKLLLGEPGPTYQLMGDCFLAADRPEEARAAFQKADQFSPDKAMRQFNLARVYAKTGKPAEALAALEAVLGRASGRPRHRPLRNAGRSARQTRQERRVGRPAGKTPRRRSEQSAAWLFSGGAVSSGRQARQGRIAVSRTAQDQADARRYRKASRRCIGRPSGTTPCCWRWAKRGEDRRAGNARTSGRETFRRCRVDARDR